jgi:hypothetical protein
LRPNSGVQQSDDDVNSDLYLVRYQVSHAVAETAESHQQLLEVNREFGLNWIRSYESDDGKQIVSVYEAPDEMALKDQALCLGLRIEDLLHVKELIPPRRTRRHRGNCNC